MEKEKAEEEKEQENLPEKDMADLAADAEEEKDADAEKVEEKAEKEKESTLDKWVRKVTVENVERQDILLQSVIRTPENGKEKERVFGMFTESLRIGIKKVNNGMRNGRIGTTMKASSSSNKHHKHQVHRASQV